MRCRLFVGRPSSYGRYVAGHRKRRSACIAWRNFHDRHIQLARWTSRNSCMAETEEVVLHGTQVAKTHMGVELYLLESSTHGAGSEKPNFIYPELSIQSRHVLVS